ncbi:MAG: hypothetical protein CMB80_02305 [Flammeovirgaceae bacterium]|nr:hypothetical protein [Flammeovirgaceae bacterium]
MSDDFIPETDMTTDYMCQSCGSPLNNDGICLNCTPPEISKPVRDDTTQITNAEEMLADDGIQREPDNERPNPD